MIDLFDLTGKVAVVSGSTRGMGRGIAEAFIAAGATVAISSESDVETGAVATQIRRVGGCL